ncbi:hypothetical protein [Wenyingzhuangia sp. IMCC45467]
MKKLIIPIVMCASLLSFSCKEKSQAEKVEDKIEEISDDISDAAHDVGDEIKDAVNEVADEVEDATD